MGQALSLDRTGTLDHALDHCLAALGIGSLFTNLDATLPHFSIHQLNFVFFGQ
jgi:hypothetical protein